MFSIVSLLFLELAWSSPALQRRKNEGLANVQEGRKGFNVHDVFFNVLLISLWVIAQTASFSNQTSPNWK